jgi:hypothetical protein
VGFGDKQGGCNAETRRGRRKTEKRGLREDHEGAKSAKTEN